jgi:PhnB protein
LRQPGANEKAMSEIELTERLDQAIDALLAAPKGERPADVDQEIAELLAIAVELRDLPRADFKARLKAELIEATSETIEKDLESAGSKIRRTVTPYIIVSDVHQEIDFIQRAFGAEGKVYGLGSQGGYHSEYRIGDSMLMIGGGGEGSKWKGTPVPCAFHLYVENVDGVYQQAMEAGATSLMRPTDMEYGERSASIEDAGGNQWFLATAFGDSYVPQGLPNLMPCLFPIGAPKMIDFLKQAFNAEELGVHRLPDGVVKHATVKIGNSVVEMGEAHGRWQPRPMHFMMSVEDADEAYTRAMKAAGAISIQAPANQPYGGRTGTIQDPFGNTWYLSSQTTKDDKSERGH